MQREDTPMKDCLEAQSDGHQEGFSLGKQGCFWKKRWHRPVIGDGCVGGGAVLGRVRLAEGSCGGGLLGGGNGWSLGKQGWEGSVASRNVVGGGAGSTTGKRWKSFRRGGSASGRS